MSPVDVAILFLLAVALLRGLLIGVVREVFSLAALAAACLAVRLGSGAGAAWLTAHAPVELGPTAALVAAGAGIGLATALAVGLSGRLLRRGLHAAGLGPADRFAGGLLGVAEGALVAAVLLVVGIVAVGRDHPLLAGSRSLEALERVEQVARGQALPLPPVAAPPRDGAG